MIELLKIPTTTVVDNYEEPFVHGFDRVYYDPSERSFIRTGKQFSVSLVNSCFAVLGEYSIRLDIDYNAFLRLQMNKSQTNELFIALMDHYGITAYDLPDEYLIHISKAVERAKFLLYFGELVEK